MPTSIRLDDELEEWLDRWAEREGIGRSQLIRRLLYQHFDDEGNPQYLGGSYLTEDEIFPVINELEARVAALEEEGDGGYFPQARGYFDSLLGRE